MVLAAPGPLLTPPPSSSPPKTPHRSYSAQTRSQNEEKNTVLQSLALTSNGLGEVGGKAVGEALRVNTVLQTLDLSYNDLDEVGGTAVGEALRVNTVLQTLDLSWNRLGKVGGQGYRLAEPLATH